MIPLWSFCRASDFLAQLTPILIDRGRSTSSENETFWSEFLRDLNDRGLHAVKLVMSAVHAGPRAAIRRVLQNAGWQRGRRHAMRNLMGVARHDQRQVIGALVRTVFAQPDRDRAVIQLRQVVAKLEAIAPTVGERLQAMEDGLLAYASFPPDHSSKIWSPCTTNASNKVAASRPGSIGLPFAWPRITEDIPAVAHQNAASARDH